jgi:hypothetical protein
VLHIWLTGALIFLPIFVKIIVGSGRRHATLVHGARHLVVVEPCDVTGGIDALQICALLGIGADVLVFIEIDPRLFSQLRIWLNPLGDEEHIQLYLKLRNVY